MLRTSAALRFGVQRAEDPHDDDVPQEPGTLLAKEWPVFYQCRHFFIIKVERFSLSMVVVPPAIHGNEADQFVSVGLDFLRGGYDFVGNTFQFQISHFRLERFL